MGDDLNEDGWMPGADEPGMMQRIAIEHERATGAPVIVYPQAEPAPGRGQGDGIATVALAAAALGVAIATGIVAYVVWRVLMFGWKIAG